VGSNTKSLAADHTPEAIQRRIAQATQHSYLGDFVLGAVDGTVTTFAIVAGVAGAGLSSGIAIVLGLANVVADGFSMAASNYLKARSDRQVVDQIRRQEEIHIEEIPEGERAEIEEIFSGKGFEGELLDRIVKVITSDRRRWVDTMLTEEWGLQLDTPSPSKAALATFLAFVAAGLIPLLPLFVAAMFAERQMFLASAGLTAITFFLIGVIRGQVAERGRLVTGLETLLVGGAAAGFAYFIGAWLKGLAVG
jgi:VIT1/CCC1 family predicted Fe2+/Mn2+ transporter